MEERIEESRGEDGTIFHVPAFGFVDPIRLNVEELKSANERGSQSS